MNSQLIDCGKHPVVITEDTDFTFGDIFQALGIQGRDLFVLMDENTRRDCLPVVQPFLPKGFHQLVMGAGERSKTLSTCEHIWGEMLRHRAGRKSVLMNLGGGVVCDTGAFSASVFMRGIRFLHIPTSLLAMADAAIGGKCGVDLNSLKNTIGLYSFPYTVVCLPQLLNTLPANEWENGAAEIIKHGMISGEQLLNRVESWVLGNDFPETDDHNFSGLLADVIRVKAAIVRKDPYENGERRQLNLGHTIGHALESYMLQNSDVPWSHGKAVAAGMMCEGIIAKKLYKFSDEGLARLQVLNQHLFGQVTIPPEAFQPVCHLLKADKKQESGQVVMVLPERPGKIVIHKGITEDMVYEALHTYNGMNV
jgi:3-dehydroquinate synthase